MESFDDLDREVVMHLGYAVARAQLLEHALVRLLEAQRFDVSGPLDDRWDDISRWLNCTAGQLANQLNVPETVAEDLKAVVRKRNAVAHRAWTDYRTARDIAQGDAAADDWIAWLDEQAERLGRAFNVVIRLVRASREAHPEPVEAAEIERAWRAEFPEPIE